MKIKFVIYAVSFYGNMQAMLDPRLYYNFHISHAFKFVAPRLKRVYLGAMQYFDAESALLLLYFLNIIKDHALSAL